MKIDEHFVKKWVFKKIRNFDPFHCALFNSIWLFSIFNLMGKIPHWTSYPRFNLIVHILFPKLFWPTVRKNSSSDWEKLLEIEPGGREFVKILRSLEQFIQTVKGQNNFW